MCSPSPCAATPAAAHGEGEHTGYVSTVSGVEPLIPGLLVDVTGAHEWLSVRNWTPARVVIFDERGRPAETLQPGETRAWRDPRIQPPPGAPPKEEGIVRNWRIPGEAGGRRFEIVGFLGYRPPPQAPEDALPRWAVAAAAAAGAGALAAALALPRLRRKDEGARR